MQRTKRPPTLWERSLERFNLSVGLIRASPLAVAGLTINLALAVIVVLAPVIAPYDPDQVYLNESLQPPSLSHLAGTDQYGRDIFSRILYGGRVSFLIPFYVIVIAAPLGTLMGLVAGYLGGKVDEALMRIADIFVSIPGLILAMAFAAALGRGNIANIMIALSLTAWPPYARLVRSITLQIREETYIEAAKANGCSSSRIMLVHIFPMLSSPVIVQTTTQLGAVILAGAALGYVGLGLSPPTAEWGLMVAEGQPLILSAWWVSTLPGLVLLISAIAFNLIGDSIRDIFDVRLISR